MKINSSDFRFPCFVEQAPLTAPSLFMQPSGMYRSTSLFICAQLIRLNLDMRNMIKSESPLRQVLRNKCFHGDETLIRHTILTPNNLRV